MALSTEEKLVDTPFGEGGTATLLIGHGASCATSDPAQVAVASCAATHQVCNAPASEHACTSAGFGAGRTFATQHAPRVASVGHVQHVAVLERHNGCAAGVVLHTLCLILNDHALEVLQLAHNAILVAVHIRIAVVAAIWRLVGSELQPEGCFTPCQMEVATCCTIKISPTCDICFATRHWLPHRACWGNMRLGCTKKLCTAV